MESFTLYYTAWFLLSLAAVIHLLLFKREPSSTIAWLLFVVLVPFVGAFIFLVFGPQRVERQAFRRRRNLEPLINNPQSAALQQRDARVNLSSLDMQVFTLARRISEYGETAGNQVQIFHDPAETLTTMREVIQKAKHFIHLEYYIIESDEVTQQLFDDLLVAAQRGVEVRILYDSLGSLFLKRRYFKKLNEAGAKIAGFLPFSFIPQRWNLNFRNHRKILVVDGTTAFTGGTNIGRQYLGKKSPHQWHDYTARIQGKVCLQLEDVFAKDWHFTTQEDLFKDKYYPKQGDGGNAIIQVLESGPDSTFLSLHQALFLALNLAREEILLTTPYFVPDPSIISSLTVAALRGVKIKILLPNKSDLKLVQYASRSFYDNLLKAGVEIYEYRPRVLHAKLLTIDGKWTMLGSANMDIRSFRLNFELNLLVYGEEVATQARQLFQRDLPESKKIELDDFLRRPISQMMLENACRLMSPIL